ncbi:MAG TPA: hypothetical protein VGK90_11805 [Rhizomicrobium sp.]
MPRARNKIEPREEVQSPKRAVPVRKRRKSLRQHFCDGLAAAVKAEPEAFKATRPRTMMGLMVRELVGAAANARCDAIKLVFAYLDQAENERIEAEAQEAGDDSREEFESDSPAPRWDWDEDGGWDSSEKPNPQEDTEREARTEKMRGALLQKFIRVADAERENEERAARLAAERGEAAPSAPFPGNYSPSSQSNGSGSVRIGGKLVES